MWIGIVSIFPELFEPFLGTSLIGRAIENDLLEVEVLNLRDFTEDPHRSVDDEPYGGGGGMVMTAPPWLNVVESVEKVRSPHRILLSPQGRKLDEVLVRKLAKQEELLLCCGRYEGLDERVHDLVIDEEISIGDFVLSGGEIPAMALVEALSRQISGVVGLPSSVVRDSFRTGLLDFPHYTRPAEVKGLEVPAVLRSGHHAEIEKWRELAALRGTRKKRPELLENAELTAEQRRELRRLDRMETKGCE